MSELFQTLSRKFANDTDQAIRARRYVRGDLFCSLTANAIPAGGCVLDYGCGPGRLGVMLARNGFTVKGMDISEGMLSEARTLDVTGLKIEFELITNAARALPPDTFDGVVCSSVIEYVEDAESLLRDFHRSIRKSGALIVSYANASSLFRQRATRESSQNPMGPAQHHTWDWAGFRSLLERCEFEVRSQPQYFESPWDCRPWGRWFRGSSYVGTLGVIAAFPIKTARGDRKGLA